MSQPYLSLLEKELRRLPEKLARLPRLKDNGLTQSGQRRLSTGVVDRSKARPLELWLLNNFLSLGDLSSTRCSSESRSNTSLSRWVRSKFSLRSTSSILLPRIENRYADSWNLASISGNQRQIVFQRSSGQ